MSAAPLASPVVELDCGTLRGTTEDGVAVFRAVPYAAPPIGALRFQRPQTAPAWQGERDATAHGPIAPQPPSRLRAAMGDFTRPQSEDCLTLTIWTPAADAKRRPVVVWFHGGAFMSGAGSLAWYSGATMARRGDVVVVGVNYRLGALGFMHLPGVSEPNLGLHDQLAALEWVSRRVAAFGGDPSNITVAGQSAGGFSALAMLAIPAARALIRRAIVQSAPFGRVLRTLDDAASNRQRLQQLLGIETPAQWRDVPVPELIAAQSKLAMALAQFANAMPPFTPVADHVLFGDEIVPAAVAGAAERDVLVGHTRDEMAAFFVIDERVKNATPDAVDGRFRDYFGAAAGEAAAEYRSRARDASPAALLGELTGDALFAAGTWEFGERLAALGKPAFVYRFDFAPPGNAFAACHCSELPFVFDNLDAWQAPMLAGGDPVTMRRLGDQMQDAWIAFARSGNPSHEGLPPWPHFDLGPDGARRTMVFDAESRVVADPAGRARWRHWA